MDVHFSRLLVLDVPEVNQLLMSRQGFNDERQNQDNAKEKLMLIGTRSCLQAYEKKKKRVSKNTVTCEDCSHGVDHEVS